ncbi:MAG: MFS transporter [Gemmatimonadota bacterium]
MDRKQVGAWALYDFANSVYPAVVQTAVFALFYTSVVVGNESGDGSLWWGAAVSISVLIVALTSPLLGAVADRGGIRKRLMLAYTLMCVVGVSFFSILEPGMALVGLILYVIANVGFEGALVFYNAYLPDIVPPEKQGWVSGLGFGVGYLGSVVGLLMALALVPEHMHGVWFATAGFFAVFSIPTFIFLPRDEPTGMGVGAAVAWGISHFRQIVGEVLALRELRRFLLAFFFYIDAILTVIVMAGPFAESEFGFGQREAIILFLVVQFSALAGAFALARPTDRFGPKKVLTGTILLWAAIAVGVYFIRSPALFFGLAVVAGFGLGSTQAASRAFMASLVPDGREAEMFGFYAFCGKSSSIIGPALFGFIAKVSGGNQRISALAMAGLLLLGLVLLQRVRDPKGAGALA